MGGDQALGRGLEWLTEVRPALGFSGEDDKRAAVLGICGRVGCCVGVVVYVGGRCECVVSMDH
jgi:hypothetical protein